jgi:hypothetical protein
VPLPTSNPRKTQTLVNGPFSRSLEEVEEDLFLERVVTMGRGSRRLPTPGGTIRYHLQPSGSHRNYQVATEIIR